MKLVKEHINEKFEDESDSVRDMHVGGIDLKKELSDTVGEGIRKWYKFLWDLQLIGKKVTVYQRIGNTESSVEKTFVITNIKKAFPVDIYFYYEENGEEKHIKVDTRKKMYIHEN